MTLLERYLNYLSQICEGSRTPPEGILLTRTGDMEKAIELQQQIAGLGIPEFVRRCAAQDGEEIPAQELESFDASQMLSALTQMDAAKILLGFPNYAYDWTLPFTAGATRAQSIGNEAAPLLAAQYGAEIQFDTQSQTPYFTYLDEAGQPHEVWFEDVRSAQAKFALLPEYGLLGLGYWNFMRPFTAGFSLQNYLFTASGLR